MKYTTAQANDLKYYYFCCCIKSKRHQFLKISELQSAGYKLDCKSMLCECTRNVIFLLMLNVNKMDNSRTNGVLTFID